MTKAGLVLGGKTKYGFFTDGVLDVFLESGIDFPYLVSTSGTARAAANFISGQAGRYFRQAEEEAYRQSGIMRRFLSDDKNNFSQIAAFDYSAYFSSETKHELVLTDYDTGKPAYLSEKKLKSRFDLILSASESEPFLSHEVRVDNKEYFSGVISDAIPLKRCISFGCKKVVLVLSEAFGQLPLLEQAASSFYWLAFRKHPEFAQSAANYDQLIKKQLNQLKTAKATGNVFVIQPQADFNERNVSPGTAYFNGREQALKELEKLKDFLKD